MTDGLSGEEHAGLSDKERNFFAALTELRRLAGNPRAASLIQLSLSPTGGTLLNKASLSDWFGSKTVPGDSESFRWLIDYLLERAAKKNVKGLKGRRHFEFLRAEAAEAKSLRMGSGKAAGKLEMYLRAVSEVAFQHPNPGTRRWTTPSLTDVYQPQIVIKASPGGAGATKGFSAPADGSPWDPVDVLHGGSCVLVAGPGGGKSSLLRQVLRAGLKEEAGHGSPVPVLLPAWALTGSRSLWHSVAQYVVEELGPLAGAHELFGGRPRPHARWLLLVDGLDEIIDPGQRKRVLEILKGPLQGTDPVCVAVVASRPLPEDEFKVLQDGVPRFELQPFDRKSFNAFTHAWFSAQGAADPAGRSASLARSVSRSGHATLAHTPLMAAMLCYLFEPHDQAEEPVGGRSDLYGRFTDLLWERQFHSGLRQRIEAALNPYGDNLSEHVVEETQKIVEMLASNAVSTDSEPLTMELGQCPPAVPKTVWRVVVRDSLRSTGLLVERAGKWEFIHHTLAEFLTVRSLARDPAVLRKQALAIIYASPRVGLGRLFGPPFPWHAPASGDSYAGFVLDRAQESGLELDRAFRRLTARGGTRARSFIVRQHILGTHVPSQLVDASIEKLTDTAFWDGAQGEDRIDALDVLLTLEDPRAELALAEVAAHPHRLHVYIDVDPPIDTGAGPVHEGARSKAIKEMMERKALVTALSRIAHNPDMPDKARVYAAWTMVIKGWDEDEQRGIDALEALTRSGLDAPAHRLAVLNLAALRRRNTGIIGAVTGPPTSPDTVLLGRFDASGRFRWVGRISPVEEAAGRELGALLAPANTGHPWDRKSFRSGWKRQPLLGVARVELAVVVEVDSAPTYGRWSNPVGLLRVRHDLTPSDVPSTDETPSLIGLEGDPAHPAP
ncbi:MULTISPECIES: NACHT domain-containing protein [Streptomyces]|nr:MULTISPECIES: NACHT domain-containing protein [Streptomyces]MZD17158.1 NACHT domain-containing protein [Streptomyces sp. SID5476]